MPSRAKSNVPGATSRSGDPAPVPPPPAHRDPWLWLTALAVLPAVIHSWGAPLGEPIADDFGFLHRALLERDGSFFDGYSGPYWRPLSRQLYYGLLGNAILAHPAVSAALHAALLAAASVLLYRALRGRWSGPVAAAAASFPLLMESSRMLLAWPSHFQDVGALFFAALAVHEASRSRLPTMLVALAAALLSKEVGLVAAVAVPLAAPARVGGDRRWRRVAWRVSPLVVVGVWAVVYARLIGTHMVTVPQGDAAVLRLAWPGRFAWALWNGLRAAFSLSSDPGPWHGAVGWGAGGAAAAVAARLASSAPARARLRPHRGVMVWGLVWFLVATATLAETHPAWWPNRAVVGAAGLGIVLTALASAADARLLAALFALRLLAFAISPAPPRTVSAEPAAAGDAFDFHRLVRLQRLVRDTRRLLAARFPTLPRAAGVSQRNLPLLSEYAFAGSKALQVWYRDSTLRRVRFEEFRAGGSGNVVGLFEWQPRGASQVALVETEAMRCLLRATDGLVEGRFREAVAELVRADSLQRDRDARVFLGTVAAKRALCLLQLGESEAAARAAREGLLYWPENQDSHYALAVVYSRRGDPTEAIAQLDSLLALYPNDPGARALRDQLTGARTGPAP